MTKAGYETLFKMCTIEKGEGYSTLYGSGFKEGVVTDWNTTYDYHWKRFKKYVMRRRTKVSVKSHCWGVRYKLSDAIYFLIRQDMEETFYRMSLHEKIQKGIL